LSGLQKSLSLPGSDPLALVYRLASADTVHILEFFPYVQFQVGKALPENLVREIFTLHDDNFCIKLLHEINVVFQQEIKRAVLFLSNRSCELQRLRKWHKDMEQPSSSSV